MLGVRVEIDMVMEGVAAYLEADRGALTCEPILQGSRVKQNVSRLKYGSDSYLLKRHDVTGVVPNTRYTPYEIEVAVLSLLRRNGCRVPEVLWCSDAEQVLLMEWCGGLTLDAVAQTCAIGELKPLLGRILTEFCCLEVTFRRNRDLLKPYTFSGRPEAVLEGLLRQGRQTLGYLGSDMNGSQAAGIDRAWEVIADRLRAAPLTLDSLDYQSRNIVISEGVPFFVDFASVGWDWQERRLVQSFNSIGANCEGAGFVSLLDRDLVARYAAWVREHREACSVGEIAARVDSHHLLFYLSVIYAIVRAVARPEAVESRVRRAAWGDLGARYRGALGCLVGTVLSDDEHTAAIREIVGGFVSSVS